MLILVPVCCNHPNNRPLRRCFADLIIIDLQSLVSLLQLQGFNQEEKLSSTSCSFSQDIFFNPFSGVELVIRDSIGSLSFLESCTGLIIGYTNWDLTRGLPFVLGDNEALCRKLVSRGSITGENNSRREGFCETLARS